MTFLELCQQKQQQGRDHLKQVGGNCEIKSLGVRILDQKCGKVRLVLKGCRYYSETSQLQGEEEVCHSSLGYFLKSNCPAAGTLSVNFHQSTRNLMTKGTTKPTVIIARFHLLSLASQYPTTPAPKAHLPIRTGSNQGYCQQMLLSILLTQGQLMIRVNLTTISCSIIIKKQTQKVTSSLY